MITLLKFKARTPLQEVEQRQEHRHQRLDAFP